MNRLLWILFLVPSVISGQISFIKHHFTYIYAQEVSRPYEFSNGNLICSVQHGQNNVWFNVLYLFDECGEFITSLHVSTPEEYMFFSDFVQVDSNRMIASAFVVDSVYHSVLLTLDINTLEVLDERRYFEGNGHRVDRSFVENGRVYQLGGYYGNIVSSAMDLNLTRNLHIYRIFGDREYPDLRYSTTQVHSRNRIYSVEMYDGPGFILYSVLRSLDGKLREVFTLDLTTDSVFVEIRPQVVCYGNDTLLIGCIERDTDQTYQRYIRKFYRDSLLYERPVEGFDNFFDFAVCDYINGQIRCVDYDGKIGLFDKNGTELFISNHLVPMMHEGDMSLAITSGDGGFLSVADNYVQENGDWEEALTLVKITKDFQITGKPDPKCIVSTENPDITPPEIILFPNPATGQIHITSESPVTHYRIFDQTSKLLLSGQPAAKEFSIVFQLLPGMYVVHLDSDAGTSSHKLYVPE